MAFTPKVQECTVEDDGESSTFYVKQPSGREILEHAQKAIARRDSKQPEPSAVENARESFSRFVVHKDGTPISKEEVEEMLSWRFSAMNKASDEVLDKTGLKAAAEQAKKA